MCKNERKNSGQIAHEAEMKFSEIKWNTMKMEGEHWRWKIGNMKGSIMSLD